MELWVGCIAGALEENEFLTLLAEVGFENADIEPTRIYEMDMQGRFMSAFVRATKPTAEARACCGPACCSA
jgi:arsenite methyltransferase